MALKILCITNRQLSDQFVIMLPVTINFRGFLVPAALRFGYSIQQITEIESLLRKLN